MNTDKAFSIIASIVVLATVTVVLTAKGTPGVIKNLFDGFTSSLTAAKKPLS